mmetsp:Transcript_3986/g.9504  ORF Transcript_3986/g.9504 Transcript_3986/m.9504 type:complete len:173 (-) Transcript_3986:275-793(-)
MSHVVVFPTAHPAASVPSGLKNIDVVKPKDWKTSYTLVPKINLRYGTESFFLERKIVKINNEEPTKDKQPVTMVKIVNVELSVDDMVYSVSGFVRIKSHVVSFVVFLVTETKWVVALLEFAFVEKIIPSTVHGDINQHQRTICYFEFWSPADQQKTCFPKVFLFIFGDRNRG